jgi:DNA-binding transcriptional LysR family regulator
MMSSAPSPRARHLHELEPGLVRHGVHFHPGGFGPLQEDVADPLQAGLGDVDHDYAARLEAQRRLGVHAAHRARPDDQGHPAGKKAQARLARRGRRPLEKVDVAVLSGYGAGYRLAEGRGEERHLLVGDRHCERHRARLIPSYAAQDFPSLHWMVRSGLGIAPCSLLLADSLPRGLVVMPLDPLPPRLSINAICHAPFPSLAVERFLELLFNET